MKNRIFVIISLVLVFAFLLTGCTGKDDMSFSTDGTAEFSENKTVITDLYGDDSDIPDSVQSQDILAEEAAAYRTVYVDICGAVRNPGVYSLSEDARVFDAVEAAGGLTEDASTEAVNQAERVTDGQKIYIMNQAEWTEAKESGVAASGSDAGQSSDGRVNINTASESELCTLPGIGATRAAAIIAYREKSGGFQSIEEIQKVSGIKGGTYEKICELITVQ